MQGLLERVGFTVITARNYDEALPFVEGDDLDIVLTDLKMPGKSGMDLLTYSRKRRPDVPVVMITGHGDVSAAVTAMKKGAYDFITKPVDETELLKVIQMALSESEQNREIVSDFFEEGEQFNPEFIGSTPAVENIFSTIRKIAPTDSTVLITGETGVGKELIAKAVHLESPRKKKAFVKVHCTAIPTTLVESELFGYEKGAFTGAVSTKPGRFEIADGGTLFLDEIGDIPPAVQVKLLTFLQDRAFERVGGVETLNVDVRIIAATNRDLEEMVSLGKFRADLYFRLDVIPISIPSIRERKEDIILQADYFLRKFSSRYARGIESIPPEIRTAFLNYDWPGNTRELENVVERLVLMSEGDTLDVGDLPSKIRSVDKGDRFPDSPGDLNDATRSAEKRLIIEILEKTNSNRTKAAEILGISRRTLYTKIKEHGL